MMVKGKKIKPSSLLPFCLFIALAIVGIIAGSVAWGVYGYAAVFICFLISYPCTVALYWGLLLINTAKWNVQTTFLISAAVRLSAVAAAIGFSYLYLSLTGNDSYYLFEAPIVLLLGYIIAIVSKLKLKEK